MTRLELNERVAAILSLTEDELRAALLDASRQVSAMLGGDWLEFTLDGGHSGLVNHATGDVLIDDQHVGNPIDLLRLINCLEPFLEPM